MVSPVLLLHFSVIIAAPLFGLSEQDKLTEINYHIWKIKVETLLTTYNAWNIALGVETKPDDASAALPRWLERDNAGVIILKLSVSDSLLVYVKKLTSTSSI